ncbi:MAG: LysM peptidoglycan-binding domain-containing protein [Desulfobacteraceae bacterium]|nr:MAG: LysM peptidoglycan-binding domain-containing protein [Desulfobacteraceae bacterium]
MKKSIVLMLCLGMVISAMFFGHPEAFGHGHTMNDAFPRYPDIEPNIRFWKKVYSEYSTRKGIIHDNRNLDIIYEVIDLDPPTGIGNQKSNEKKIKYAKKKYEAILKKLAHGQKPDTKTEEHIWRMFQGKKDPRALNNAWKNIRFQLGQKDRFMQGVIRSGAYLDEIRKIMKDNGLPEELSYLPHVESSFNYEAYSKFGAAGIWQFTRGTGKKYMNIDYTLDERRDPILSAHAAAKHLKSDYQKLGSWPFALTAYNHGLNGMLRARNQKGPDYASIFNEYDGRLFGFASRNFYSEFLAATEVAKNYKKYFGEIDLHPPVKRVAIPLSGYVSVSDIADHYQVTEKQIRDMNPALRNPVFLGQKYIPKGYHLYLPETNGGSVKIAKHIPETLLNTKQKPSNFYRVQKGDTAGNIARREGIRLKDLILANQLDKKATLYVGQHLRIPAPEEKLMPASVSGPEQGLSKKSRIQKPVGRPEPEKPILLAKKNDAPVPETGGSSTDREISPPVTEPQETAVQPSLLEDAGEVLTPALEKSSPEIELPTSPSSDEILEVVNPAILTGHLEVEEVIIKGKNRYGIIRVEAEETLGHYADWLELPTRTLRSLNRLKFGKSIHMDQKLKIPLNKVGKEQFEEKRYEFHKGIEEDFFSAYRIEKVGTYQVKKGDNIWTLCVQTLELPLWIIKKYNPDINLNHLQPGTELKVPIVKKLEE